MGENQREARSVLETRYLNVGEYIALHESTVGTYLASTREIETVDRGGDIKILGHAS
jgi:hypothetical protein